MKKNIKAVNHSSDKVKIMRSAPKVSVIIPVYNVEKYIAKCLDSVCSQTLKDIEIICVDDCSVDGCLGLIQGYAKKDARIKIVKHNKNMGVAVSRNDGIKTATGEYVGFVDADDYIDNDFYEKLYRIAKNGNADIAKAVLNTISICGDSNVDFYTNELIKDNKYCFNFQFTTAVYRKNVLVQNDVWFPLDIKIGEDICFLVRAVHYANMVLTANDTYYNYRRIPNSADGTQLETVQVRHSMESSINIVNFANSIKISADGYNKIIERAAKMVIYCAQKDIPWMDYDIIANMMIWMYANVSDKTSLYCTWKRKLYRMVRDNKIGKLKQFLMLSQRGIRLFGLISIGRVYVSRYGFFQFKLFDLFPVLTVRRTYKTQIFICGILVLKIK